MARLVPKLCRRTGRAGGVCMELSLDNLEWKDAYKLLIGTIVPRPIAFVSTVSQQGVNNLAAFSFFNGVCPKPFIVSFAPMFKDSADPRKDTLRNIQETGQFVVNVVTEDIVHQMNETAPEFPSFVDEFEVSGLTPVQSTKVKPARVLESPVNLECELVQIVNFGYQPGSGSLVLGKVVYAHVHDEIVQHGHIDADRMRAVGRMAGNDYARTTDRFALKRPPLPEQYR